ncbi:MBL-fold metallo-hydrolase superfamily [hydrothermal vent metagenome]|uniref:MBL-fold metallo-hydrolase superfamily n=1 Tax=hydrothermal vent metagenome TaxID=652676 RepID=A0A3B0Z244_9ZZZZ
MNFRQLFDHETYTFTYLIADEASRDAIIIDPVKEQLSRDLKLIEELGLTLRYAVDTHVHADHITSAGALRNATDCKTGVSTGGDVDCADLALNDGDEIKFGSHMLHVLTTPGHTDSCLSFRTGNIVFSGDSLFIRGTGRTDFQQGDAGKLYDSISNKLYTLPDETIVYPGHDYRGNTTTTIGEEKKFNPRMKHSRDRFIETMAALDLPDPRKIMEAVPANLACGET